MFAPLFLSQIEIPNILKQRKQLAKLVLDYDSAKTRYTALFACLELILSHVNMSNALHTKKEKLTLHQHKCMI